jgi:sugar/nucleoside kinase (ribokinase family)
LPARVLVVGDVMTDIIVRPEGPLVAGSDRRATIRKRPGGSGANQAVWLAAFGLAVRFAARVGAADHETIADRFRGLGIEPALAADPDLPSGTLVTLLAPDGERSFLTDRGANAALAAADLPEALLDGCHALVVSGYALFEPGPRSAVTALMAVAAARRLPVAVDPASVGFLAEVGPENFLAWTRRASLIFANKAEAMALTGTADTAAQLTALGATYPRVVIKRGAAGAVLGGPGGVRIERAAPRVRVTDTTGAGDAFAAAFLAADLAGLPPETCLERAVAAGAEATTRLGGQP